MKQPESSRRIASALPRWLQRMVRRCAILVATVGVWLNRWTMVYGFCFFDDSRTNTPQKRRSLMRTILREGNQMLRRARQLPPLIKQTQQRHRYATQSQPTQPQPQGRSPETKTRIALEWRTQSRPQQDGDNNEVIAWELTASGLQILNLRALPPDASCVASVWMWGPSPNDQAQRRLRE